MNTKNVSRLAWHRFVSALLVFALFIGIFPSRIIHAEDPEEDLFVSETAEDMVEDYAVWPFVQGIKKMVYGKKNFVKVMKQGIDWLQTGDKNRNIARGASSLIGSITNGIISIGKSIFSSGA